MSSISRYLVLMAFFIVPFGVIVGAAVFYRSTRIARRRAAALLLLNPGLADAKEKRPEMTDVILGNEQHGGRDGVVEDQLQWGDLMPLAFAPPHLALMVRMPTPPLNNIPTGLEVHDPHERSADPLPTFELGICAVPMTFSLADNDSVHDGHND